LLPIARDERKSTVVEFVTVKAPKNHKDRHPAGIQAGRHSTGRRFFSLAPGAVADSGTAFGELTSVANTARDFQVSARITW
jgi:hypothetical protein